MPKILIIGGDNGGGSAGDEIMCEAACSYFRALRSDLEIVTDAQSQDWRSPVSNIKVVQQLRKDSHKGKTDRAFKAALKLLRISIFPYVVEKTRLHWTIGHGKYFAQQLMTSDVVFFAGCGGLADKYPVNVLTWWSIIMAAKKLNIKVYISGAGIGPLRNGLTRHLVSRLLRSTEFVTARDFNESLGHLKALKRDGNYDWVPDDAFFYGDNGTRLTDGPGLKLGINLMPPLFGSDAEIYELAELIGQNIRACPRYTPYLLPVTHEDYAVLKKMKERIPEAVLVDCITPTAMKELVGSMNVMISARYHGCVFGISKKTPTLGLYKEDYWKQKIRGVFDMAQLDDCALSVDEFTSILGTGRLHHLLSHMANKQITDKRIEELREKAFLSHRLASKHFSS